MLEARRVYHSSGANFQGDNFSFITSLSLSLSLSLSVHIYVCVCVCVCVCVIENIWLMVNNHLVLHEGGA